MAKARSSESPKVPRSKWVLQLHRKPVRWDVLLHKLAESLARRYWYTQVHFRQEILKLEADELWDAAMQMARAFGKQTVMAAVAAPPQPSIFTLKSDVDRVIQDGTKAALSAIINYLEIAHNCFVKPNHPDLQLFAPRIAETFGRFFKDKCSAEGELHPCLEEPLGDDEGYFPAGNLPAHPTETSGDPAMDAYRLSVVVGDDDDAATILRKLIFFAKTDPFLAPEFAVELVTKLTARQLHAAKTKEELDQLVEAIYIRDRFLFSPSRQGGLQPVQLFLDQQLFASQRQKTRLHRWATQHTFGVFRVEHRTGDAATLRDVSRGREIIVHRDATIANVPDGSIIRARALPWDEQWLISGIVQLIDDQSDNEEQMRAMLHPLRLRRTADDDEPRLLKARELVKTIHAEFVRQFGSELATFPSLDACRSALATFHHYLVMELKLPDGRQFADAWQQDVGMEFLPFMDEQFAASESNVTSPGILYDALHGMAFLPNSEEVSLAMTSPLPSLEQKQAFARLLLEKWRPGWMVQRLAAEYPERLQEITRELLGNPSFDIARDLEPLLGRVKCPDHTLPSRPIPFLIA